MLWFARVEIELRVEPFVRGKMRGDADYWMTIPKNYIVTIYHTYLTKYRGVHRWEVESLTIDKTLAEEYHVPIGDCPISFAIRILKSLWHEVLSM